MMTGNTESEMVSARFLRSSGPAKIWIDQRSPKNNLLFVDDNRIVVATLARAKLTAARELLERGGSADEVLGPDATTISLIAVKAVTAKLNSTEVEVLYSRGGSRTATKSFSLPDPDAQAEFLIEVRDRMGGQTEVVEETGNRLLHAVKPLNAVILFALLAAGVHAFFAADLSDGQAMRARIGQIEWQPADPSERYATGAVQRTIPRAIARSPIATRVLVFGIIALAVVGTVLNFLGYTVSMAILLGGAGLSLLWFAARLAAPPRTLSVVSLSACR